MKPIYNLINLADFIVPEPIKQNSPQFYELIRAFLRNLESVQTSINSNFLDTIDYNKIQNTDFKINGLIFLPIRTGKYYIYINDNLFVHAPTATCVIGEPGVVKLILFIVHVAEDSAVPTTAVPEY